VKDAHVEKLLSKDEVDALMQGISSGEVDTEMERPTDPPEVKPYDLTRPERIVRSRIPFTEVLTNRFARQCRQTMTAYLRHIVDVVLVSSEIKKFAEFLRSLQNPTSIHIFRIDPLRGMGLLVLDPNLVFVLIELFMGGSGDSMVKIEGREFTNIESRLTRKVVESLLLDLEKVWHVLQQVTVKLDRSENNPKLAAVMAPSEPVICVEMNVEVEVANGTFHLCLPYSMLEPFRDKFLLGDLERGALDTAWVKQVVAHLKETSVTVCAELGDLRMSVQGIMNLCVGDVLKLDQSPGDLLRIKVEGIPKFFGAPGQYKGMRAVKMLSNTHEDDLNEKI
jgi:flagellar motor switch protein FliM